MRKSTINFAAVLACLAVSVATSTSAQAGQRNSRGNACNVAREYIRLTAEGRYDDVGGLWAEDAVFYSPSGEVIRGRTAIRQFYSRFLRKITPVNRIASLALDPNARVCVMELETRVVLGPDGVWAPDASGNFVPTAIDRFQVNRAGEVQSMRVYLAPVKAWLGN